MSNFRLPAAALFAATLFTIAACDDDDPTDPGEAVTFNVTLTPGAEVPPCGAAGANATGSAVVTINAAETQITITNFTFSGLSGAATAAHIHIGESDQVGDPVYTFTGPLTNSGPRTFLMTNYPSPAPSGIPDTWAEFIDEMKDGDTYINVHTAACEAGEIRGQLNP